MFSSSKSRDRNEGVALLFSLALLSLVILLGLTFTQTSKTESNASYNTMQYSKSKQYCLSTLDRTVSFLENEYSRTDNVGDDDDMFPATAKAGRGFFFPKTGPFIGRGYLASAPEDSDTQNISNGLSVRHGNKYFIPDAVMDNGTPRS